MKTDKLMSPGEVDADVAIRGDVLIQGFDHVAVQCLNVPVQLVRHDTDLRSDFIHEVRLAHRIHPPSTPPDVLSVYHLPGVQTTHFPNILMIETVPCWPLLHSIPVPIVKESIQVLR